MQRVNLVRIDAQFRSTQQQAESLIGKVDHVEYGADTGLARLHVTTTSETSLLSDIRCAVDQIDGLLKVAGVGDEAGLELSVGTEALIDNDGVWRRRGDVVSVCRVAEPMDRGSALQWPCDSRRRPGLHLPVSRRLVTVHEVGWSLDPRTEQWDEEAREAGIDATTNDSRVYYAEVTFDEKRERWAISAEDFGRIVGELRAQRDRSVSKGIDADDPQYAFSLDPVTIDLPEPAEVCGVE